MLFLHEISQVLYMAITSRLYLYIGLVLLLSINGFNYQRSFVHRSVRLHDAKLQGKDQKYNYVYSQNDDDFDDG